MSVCEDGDDVWGWECEVEGGECFECSCKFLRGLPSFFYYDFFGWFFGFLYTD